MTEIYYRWDGVVMIPLKNQRSKCDDFDIGKTYRLIVEEERSPESHRHYFAALHEVFINLPEDIADRFPDEESLRRWCLIKTGYADERTLVCDTQSDANRSGAFLALYEKHAIIMVKGCVVNVFTAKSQSTRAMDKATFQASKQAVLELAASMIGTTADALLTATGPTPPLNAVVDDGLPKNADEYISYASRWINQEKSSFDGYKRWDDERKLRDKLDIPMDARDAMQQLIKATFGETA